MRLLLALLMVFFSWTTSPPRANLTVVVDNINIVRGHVFMGLYNKSDSYLKEGEQYSVANIKVDAKTISHTFKNIPPGTYGISLYHDVNDDNMCNTNWIGFPTEGYGFSNNLKIRFSAPKYEDAKFKVLHDTTITISVIY